MSSIAKEKVEATVTEIISCEKSISIIKRHAAERAADTGFDMDVEYFDDVQNDVEYVWVGEDCCEPLLFTEPDRYEVLAKISYTAEGVTCERIIDVETSVPDPEVIGLVVNRADPTEIIGLYC